MGICQEKKFRATSKNLFREIGLKCVNEESRIVYRIQFGLGILLDRINGQLFLNRFDHTEYIHTEYHFNSEAYTYGLLVKYTDDYNYLIDFIKDNRLLLEICTLHRYRSHHVCMSYISDYYKLQDEIKLKINLKGEAQFSDFL